MVQDLVSIIIPTYNRRDMVADAIKSALAQTYVAKQILVIDDGSSDGTRELLENYPGIEYFYQENKGQAAARSLGLTHAKGRYIASLDSDDVWDTNFLKEAVGAIERCEVDFVFLNWRQVVDGEHVFSDFERNPAFRKPRRESGDEWEQLGPRDLRTLFLKGCAAPSSALVVKRSSIFSSWNEEMKIGDDWYFLLEMVLRKPCRAAFTRIPRWTKKVHTSNIYHGRDHFEVLKTLGLHDEVIMLRDFDEELSWRERKILKRRLAAHHFNFARLAVKRHGFSLSALESFFRAFVVAPVGGMAYVVQLSCNHLKARISASKESKTVLANNVPVKKTAA